MHLLSHEDIEVACAFCNISDLEKPPIFAHARVYRAHLALVHGADVLDTLLPRPMTPKSFAQVHEEEVTTSDASCSLCKLPLSSFAEEAADHVEKCAVYTIIQRGIDKAILNGEHIKFDNYIDREFRIPSKDEIREVKIKAGYPETPRDVPTRDIFKNCGRPKESDSASLFRSKEA